MRGTPVTGALWRAGSSRFSSAVEQRFCKPKVGGSIPSTGTIPSRHFALNLAWQMLEVRLPVPILVLNRRLFMTKPST